MQMCAAGIARRAAPAEHRSRSHRIADLPLGGSIGQMGIDELVGAAGIFRLDPDLITIGIIGVAVADQADHAVGAGINRRYERMVLNPKIKPFVSGQFERPIIGRGRAKPISDRREWYGPIMTE